MVEIVGEWRGGKIWKVNGGALPSNSFIVEAAVPGGCILIDTCLDGLLIDAALQEKGLVPHQIFCTHGHFDHIGSANLFQDKYGCEVFIHLKEEKIAKSSNFLLMACKIDQRITLPRFTYIDNQFTYRLGNEILTFVHVPGHTPGSCIIDLGDIWFTGDTIYSRGIGLSSIPGSSTEDLRNSINVVWDELDTSRIIYPGHGEHSKGSVICKENHSLLNFLDKKS